MVDIVHHTIIGVAGAGIAHSLGQDEVAVGFMIGSLLPDLDIVFMLAGKSRFLRMHQGFTHSIQGIGVLSILLADMMVIAAGMPFRPFLIGTALGMAVHVAMDLLNTFGVKALWPSKRRFSLDAFFFVDIYVLCATSMLAAAVWLGEEWWPPTIGWLLFVAAYAGLRKHWIRGPIRDHGLSTAVPSGVAPLTWFVTREDKGCIRSGTVSGIDRKLRWKRKIPHPDAALLQALRTGPVYADLEASLRRFVPVEITEVETGTRVVSRCIAVPNFGNRYGETVSLIVNGEVVNETARI